MPRRSKQVSILELILCNGGPASGEWRGPAYSEASLKDFDQSEFEGTGEHTGRAPLLVQVQGADRE